MIGAPHSSQTPTALSLSKGCFFLRALHVTLEETGQSFDKLRTDG
jgi:hypothetical protein